jgi:hypothetical protein
MSDIGWAWPEFHRVSQEPTLEVVQNDGSIQATSSAEPMTITDEPMELVQNDDVIQGDPLVEPTTISDEDADTNNGKISVFYCKIAIYI